MTSELHMNMNDYLPLRDVVFNTLREAILFGKLQPGQRLMEITLANQLGVSRTPVREAMRKLELEGLVIMVPRRGAQVAPITQKDLNDVLEVRLGLEELAMNCACVRITEEQLRQLELAAQKFESCMASGDVSKLAEADVEFHDLIYQATCNQRLIQMLNNLREQMYRYRLEYLKEANVGEALTLEHKEMCEALKERDAKKANEYMKRHIQNQQKAILKTLKESE